ncbi:MAG: protein-L-isoaspartate(D-aspartate) O-methyltransferase [Acidobacteria bacterium]|nr:protein-L-isoaspartate(D-aspartate) O-methyltransferase [Acidobacteriota bacterium]
MLHDDDAVFAEERRRMVETQLAARDIRDPKVLAAMKRVPRHLFVPENERRYAYGDGPLPIGQGQTISQPYIVAYMTQALELQPGDRVLEVGTGSGYQAAVLAELVKEVYTIEILPELARRAELVLIELGFTNVYVRAGDGYRGWPGKDPFDAIIVTAAPDHIPQPLIDQLKVGGKLVIPVGAWDQEMLIITKTDKGVLERRTIGVRFVPMTGEAQKP